MDRISKIVKGAEEKKPDKKLHSEMHVLADEISSHFGERKRFGMYLGIIKRVGVARARQIFAQIKSEPEGVQDPRKLFMWLARRDGGVAKKDET